MTERPEIVEDEHLDYLDELRESGVTNMWGAGAFVKEAFELDATTANEILAYWMQSFSERHA